MKTHEHALNKAIDLKNTGRQSEAAQIFHQLVEENTDVDQAYYHLALMAVDDKNIPQAIEYYNNAIEVNPDFRKAYKNLGLLYLQQEQYEEALDCLETVHNLNPPVISTGNVYNYYYPKPDYDFGTEKRTPELDNLFRLLSSTDKKNVTQAFELAEGMGNPPEWQKRIEMLLTLDHLFGGKKETIDAEAVCRLNTMKLPHLPEPLIKILLNGLQQIIDIELAFAKKYLQEGASRDALEDFFYDKLIIAVDERLYLEEEDLNEDISEKVFTAEVQNELIKLGIRIYAEELSKKYPDLE